MAETVGSIMAIHTGKGRYLTPENFSNELYLGDLLRVFCMVVNKCTLSKTVFFCMLFCMLYCILCSMLY